MSEQELEQLEAAPELEAAPGIEQEAPQEPEGNPELESEARKYGWRPKEEYTNNPDGWVDAEKFMSFPTTQRKIANDELQSLKRSVDETVSQRVSGIEKMLREQHSREIERQKADYDRQLATLRSQQRVAVESADTEAYDRVSQQIEGLQAPVAPEAPQPAENAIVAEYRAKNEWTRDPVMWNVAFQAVENAKVPMSVEDQLRLAEHAVKREFPDKFEKPKPPSQKVDGGGLGAGAKKAKGSADLPPEAKRQGKEFVEDGLYKSIDEYAKDYWASVGE